MKKDFINILDFTTEELEDFLKKAVILKARKRAGMVEDTMKGKTLGMYFEKDSLRTRVSLEVAMNSMSGSAIYMDFKGKHIFERESLPDQARVMSRFVDVIAMRTFSHEELEAFAEWATVPVINVLSDWSHPTQAMADIMTMREYMGDTTGKELVYIGDGNNVARSLASLCARLEIKFTIACPKGYELDEEFFTILLEKCPSCQVRQINDPIEAVKEADAVYTDVWASMGQEAETEKRKKDFAPFQINRELLNHAPKGAIVLHCLPAHRGEEITDEIMDDTSISAVFDQAENRMHINRALISVLTTQAEVSST